MRIAIVTQTYFHGNGQATFTIRLAEGLAQRGHEVLVITPAEKMQSYTSIVNGVRVEKIAAVHLALLHPSIYIAPFPGRRIKHIFNEFQPELVHIQDHYFICRDVLKEARRLHIPTMGTNHFLPENLLPFLRRFPKLQHLATVPLWWTMLSVFNKLDLATTPSKTAARILRAQKIHIPVHAISNGVDTQRFHPDPETDRVGIRRKYNLSTDRPLFLYVGRLDGEKRLDILLDAVALLPNEDFQLAIGGFGLYEGLLRKQMQTLGLEGRVSFIGYIPPEDLSSLYNSADIFVMPSPEELQSIATLEAMACGKPILAADARALPELVKPGINGYLCKACDADDTANKMKQLLSEPEKWAAMGKASFELAQKHSLQNTLSFYEEDYKKIMGKVPVKNKKSAAARGVLKKSI